MTGSSVEYELTYLAKELPANILNWPYKDLIDIYIPETSNSHPRLRLRQQGNTYQITKKIPVSGQNSSTHHEYTIDLTQEEFTALATCSHRSVSKRRYYGEISGRNAEVDVFTGPLTGLVVIDFEFESSTDMEAFTQPKECLADITPEKFIAGGMLAGKNYKDIEYELARYNYKPLKI